MHQISHWIDCWSMIYGDETRNYSPNFKQKCYVLFLSTKYTHRHIYLLYIKRRAIEKCMQPLVCCMSFGAIHNKRCDVCYLIRGNEWERAREMYRDRDIKIKMCVYGRERKIETQPNNWAKRGNHCVNFQICEIYALVRVRCSACVDQMLHAYVSTLCAIHIHQY